MRCHYILALAAMLANPLAVRADGGYFSDGDKQLVFKEQGERSRTEKITLFSLAGGAVLTGAVGGLFMLDAQSKAGEVSASGMHTLKVWSPRLEDTRKGAIRSSNIGAITLGISGALAATTIVAYIITQPDEKVGYQDWQTSIPTITPRNGGAVMSREWSF